MQLDFFGPLLERVRGKRPVLVVGTRVVPVHFIRNRRARRYILRMQADGSVRAIIPRCGSAREARAFAERNVRWIDRQLQKGQEPPLQPRVWRQGTAILFRGERTPLVVEPGREGSLVRFADQLVPVVDTSDLRPAIEDHLRGLARVHLSARTGEFAARHQLAVGRVVVRGQRSRWGSCSRKGTISLNWRLMHAPDFVQDYLVVHELMHLREMNHSPRFWRLVEQACPRYRESERWLKQHRGLLR